MSESMPAPAKYRLVARLGSGGMAEVYLAVSGTPQGFSKLQVLKMLRPDLNEEDRDDFLRMFQDEAKLATRLNHPNIVQSHDVGFEASQPFIAMEYLDGQPLSRVQERLWKQRRKLIWGLELFPLCQVLDALEYAHGLTDYDGTPLDIVHRDVSPQNVFVTYSGHTKLVDFGIAKTLESCKTRAGVVKGKIPYMSREQVMGQPIDHRTDLFSVGVILWETVARQSMHGQDAMFQILSRVVGGQLPHIRDVAPNAPDALVRVLDRALALAPEERYPDAGAFRDDLDAFIEQEGRVTAREVGRLVSELFSEERKQVNEAIRHAMAHPDDRYTSTGARGVFELPPTLSTLTSKILAVPQDDSQFEASAPDTTPFDQETAPPVQYGTSKASSAGRKALAIGAALLLAGIAIIAYRAAPSSERPVGVTHERPGGASTPLSRGEPADVAPAVLRETHAPVAMDSEAPRAAETGATETGAPPVRPSSHRVRIEVHPPHAQLTIDGRVVGTGEYSGAHSTDSSPAALVVSAPGYITRSRKLRFERDIDLSITLAPVPSSARALRPVAARAAAPLRKTEDPSEPRREPLYDEDFPTPKRRAAPPLDTEDPW